MSLFTIRTARAAAIDHLTHQLAAERQHSQWLKRYAEQAARARNEFRSRAREAERNADAMARTVQAIAETRDLYAQDVERAEASAMRLVQVICEQDRVIRKLKQVPLRFRMSADREVRYECFGACLFMAAGSPATVADLAAKHAVSTGHRRGFFINATELPA